VIEEKINIDIDSEKYSVVVRSGDVSNLKIILPLFNLISSEFKKDESGEYDLKIHDRVAGYHFDREKVSYGYSLNPLSRKIKIIVPSEWVTNLSINVEYGSVLIRDLIINNTEVSSVRGNVIVRDCSCEELAVDGIKANISLERVNANNVMVTSTTGNLLFSDNDFSYCVYETEVGNIDVKFLNYDLENMSIYIRDRKMLKDEISEKDLGKRLYFTTTYGKFKSNTF